jgi:hypothetical protein
LVTFCVTTSLQNIIEGKIREIEVTGRRRRNINRDWMTLGNEIILEIAGGRSRSPSVEKWLYKRLLPLHNTDHRTNE